MTARRALAVLGAGWIVQRGYAPFFASGAFEVVAVHDPDPAAMAALIARVPGAAPCRSVDDCLAHPADAVLIATPSPSHVELAAQALRAGRHVLCEKPVAVTSSEVRALRAAEAAGGTRLVGAAVCRHRDDVRCFLRWAAELAVVDESGSARRGSAAEGQRGGIDELELTWIRHRGVPAPGSWRTQRAGGTTGVLADLGYHLLDLAVAVHGVAPRWRCASAHRSSSSRGDGAGWFGGAPAAPYDVEDRIDAVLIAGDARLRLRATWVDDEPGDVTVLRAISRTGIVELVGLFGYSDQRRVAEQVCTLRSTQRDDRAVFEPGPRLHAAAFGDVLAELARVCEGEAPRVGLAEIEATAKMIEAIRAVVEPT